MIRSFLLLNLLLLPLPSLRAEDPKPVKAPKALQEFWDALYLEGAKTGYYHTTVTEIERDGKKVLRTSSEMNLTLRRYKETVAMRMESANEETPDGKVVTLSFTQHAGDKKLEVVGKVVDGKLQITTPDGKTLTVPWNDKAIGMNAERNIYADRKVKPGDRLSWVHYDLSMMLPITVRAVVKQPEEVDMLMIATEGKDKGKAIRVKKKLLRVEVESEEVKVGGQTVQLPGLVSWLDDKLQEVRNELEQPGLGKITDYRTTKEAALEKGVAPELLPDLGINSLVFLNRSVPRPLTSKSALYRITLKGDKDAASAFTADGRQEVKNSDGDHFELLIKAQQPPAKGDKSEKPAEEYLEPSFFLDSDNKDLKKLALKIVGDETDPWKKAQKIEKWVHENMHADASIDFIPASKICTQLRGDCRQHGMLAATLCRAVGVPSRTALGLVSLDLPDGKSILGFHLWTEVWVEGKWYGLDATLGKGRIGVGHIKILDTGWANTQTLGPLVPLNRILSKLKVEVLKVEE